MLVNDLRDIVTALWASGAEAISINGERLVATSSIYGVGASVLVNTAFLSPPFQIEAIGSDGLLERFQSHPAFLGRVAQRLEPRKFEKAAIAFDGVDEAEDGIEARAVVGLGFPGDDLPAQGFEHLPAFRYKIGNEIVHRRERPPTAVGDAYGDQELTLRYP